jgi:hypothetical protein
MRLLAPDVAQRVAREYAEDDRAATIELLASYDGRERERVQHAILTLASGDLARLQHNVRQALADFRDVLYWAEEEEG